ncbi:hypothetical protein [Schinkia azotoformans]|uniref:hypothetical protein n=1 Tax=Schinkia azotoformans TaxID=1454 RepID=UPI002DBFC3FA|nr:hypothetical protein [Schinkia azotoformans]MEC1698028.1 hypothetical protein [Schinkia azotoformans]
MEIDKLIKEFQEKLDNPSIPILDIVQRHLTYGTPVAFKDDEDTYFEIKKRIATQFDIAPEDVFMVGSGKLGFSLNTDQLWKPYDEESDMDMVIVSDKVFSSFWYQLYEFNIDITDRTKEEDKRYKKFLKYFLKGWIRPDFFPEAFKGNEEWEDFFTGTMSYKKEYGGRKITGAVYREPFFYESYHKRNLEKIRLERMLKK